MDTALSALFAIAGIFALSSMCKAIWLNGRDILGLRPSGSGHQHDSNIIVTFIEPPCELAPVPSVRRKRQIRMPAPKPMTHRLHHYSKASSVA